MTTQTFGQPTLITAFPLLNDLQDDVQILVTYAGATYNLRLGAVKTLFTKEALGLDQVDNTSDLNKPISNPMQIALSGKADSLHMHVLSDIPGLDTLLASKSDIGHTHMLADILDIGDISSVGGDVIVLGIDW